MNEPPSVSDRPEQGITREEHERVIRAVVAEIRKHDPNRLIIIDGLNTGTAPCPELVDLQVAQSCRAYHPHPVSHYRAFWAGATDIRSPVWPYRDKQMLWNRESLEEYYRPWIDLAEQGVGVHCGESGAYIYTPHDVFLSWYEDVLDVLTAHNIGYALWNFRGPFGLLDSNRPDAEYVMWRGRKLDVKLLELLNRY